MLFHIVDNFGNKIFGNCPIDCIKCFHNCTITSKIIECPRDKRKKRTGKIRDDECLIFLCKKNNLKSSKVFKKELTLLKNFFYQIESYKLEIIKDVNSHIARLLHNITTYNAHIIQDIYSIIPQDKMSMRGKDIINAIREELQKNDVNNSISILRILKHANFLKSEFSIFNKLYESYPSLNLMEHEIHKVILLVFNAFWYDLLKNNNYINIQDCTEKLTFDYESITAAFAHIIDNATKYIAPHSQLKVNFIVNSQSIAVEFAMQSIVIEKDELHKIFEEGYSGKYPTKHNKKGKGIGLYMVRRLLALNEAKIEVVPNYDESTPIYFDEIPYQKNIFRIIFNRNVQQYNSRNTRKKGSTRKIQGNKENRGQGKQDRNRKTGK